MITTLGIFSFHMEKRTLASYPWSLSIPLPGSSSRGAGKITWKRLLVCGSQGGETSWVTLLHRKWGLSPSLATQMGRKQWLLFRPQLPPAELIRGKGISKYILLLHLLSLLPNFLVGSELVREEGGYLLHPTRTTCKQLSLSYIAEHPDAYESWDSQIAPKLEWFLRQKSFWWKIEKYTKLCQSYGGGV